VTALAPLTERDFQRQVTKLAELLGWSWAHFRPARTADSWRTPVSGPLGRGWPDLVLVHPGRRTLIFAELKRDGSKTSDAQDGVLEALRCLRSERRPEQYRALGFGALGIPIVRVEVWRPADWPAIEEALL